MIIRDREVVNGRVIKITPSIGMVTVMEIPGVIPMDVAAQTFNVGTDGRDIQTCYLKAVQWAKDN